ncbi:three-helix bundle dimerization domain-containing protein [Nocardia sp. NPDC055002]
MGGFTEEPPAAFTAQTMPSALTANDWIAPDRCRSAPVGRHLVLPTRSLDPVRETTASPVVTASTASELDSIATVLMSRFPGHSLAEVRDVVYDAYRRIASAARITTHLIPLTVNRARTIMMTKDRAPGA